MRSVVLDPLDRAILSLLQRDARASSEAIAREVALSPTAVQRRIRRLREAGVIRAEVAVLDPAAVGRGLTAIVGIVLVQGSRDDLIDAFKRRMAARPEVQQCYYVSGEHDFVLIVTARDMADYERVSRALLFNDANIRKFTTTFVLDAVKAGLAVPVNPSEG